MTLFKSYSSIKDFLYRFTLLKIGKLHIRLHQIKDKDSTGLFHNHPFKYISIILRGGYTEEILKDDNITTKTHSTGSIIFRGEKTLHKISECNPKTVTLFLAWGNYGWHAVNTGEATHKPGVYRRMVNDAELWAKREKDIWFIGHKDYTKAQNETRHSIHQRDYEQPTV